MSTVKAHLRPKGERKSKAFFEGKTVKTKQYEQTEALICAIVCDIINGVPRSDIIYKLREGLYADQRKPYKEPTANEYYFIAMQRIRDDREENIEMLKDKLYGQYYQLYNEAIESGENMQAKAVLDSIAKTFLGDNKNVNVKGNINGNINVSFGFEKDE